MNRKGVTITELLIYISLFAIISLFIGRQFKTLTNNYSTGKRIARQQTDTRDILGLMVRELRNTGLKVYMTGTSTLTKNIAPNILISATDSSSFIHTEQSNGTYNDAITIKKIRLSNTGTLEYSDKIDYYVSGTTLRRALKTNEVPDTTNSIVAENVYGLQFKYGYAKTTATVIDENPMVQGNWTVANATGTAPLKIITIPNEITLQYTTAATGALRFSNSQKSIVKNRRYSVHLNIIPSGGFLNQIDSLRFAFKNVSTYYGFEKFKPHKKDMWITVGGIATGNADLLLEYDVNTAGKLKITGIEVFQTEDSTYTWSSNPALADKKNVRAIRMYVLTRSTEKTNSASSASVKIGDLTFTPPAGNYSWRVHEETIDVPNNGAF